MTPTPAPQPNVESLRRSVQSLTIELLAVYEELELLYSLGAQVGRLADGDQIAAVTLRKAIEILEADCGWVVLLEGETPRVPEGCCVQIEKRTALHVYSEVLESLYPRGKSQALMHSLKELSLFEDADVPGPFLAAFLSVGQNSLGYLCLGRRDERRSFTSADQKLSNAVANLLAVELENVRLRRSELEKCRLVNELELARNIQQSLLPRNFSCTDFLEAAGVSEPCYEIGGDLFDVISITPDLCLLVIADVSGKGPSAALQAAMVQGVVHAVSRSNPELPFLMGTLNACILARSLEGHFVTAFAATLDKFGRLQYANAGHTRPLWIRADGQAIELAEAGPLLGLFDKPHFPQGSVQLSPGDLLLLFTDGVTEAEDPQGNPFGTARLLDWAIRQAGEPPGEVKESLIGAVNRFCGGRRYADDLTVLIAQYTGNQIRNALGG
jgi:serine phosphatase RsbU (regulator of sigma subunit)